jgi:FAM192A/Fyv6, N-terminal domain
VRLYSVEFLLSPSRVLVHFFSTDFRQAGCLGSHGRKMNGSSSFKPSGSVTSRFVRQTDLEEAQKRREEEVRATYARLGQSPPPEALAAARKEAGGGDGSTYDPRTLYERLKANKDAKQEAIDEKLKLGNQFRGIDDSESIFLAQVATEKREAERLKERETENELERFRKAAVAKEFSPPELPAKTTTPISASSTNKGKSAKRKREGILGVVKKKKIQSEGNEKNKEENKKDE